jgi:hypothetical protein
MEVRMAKFLVLARGTGVRPEMRPEEIQQIMGKYIAWTDGLRNGGKLHDTNKLCDGEGRVMRRSNAKLMVTDGPYAESNEVLGGYWMLEADDYAQAQRLLDSHPHLEFGTLEVRQVADLTRLGFRA